MTFAAGVGMGAFGVLLVEALAVLAALWLARGAVNKLLGG